MVKKTCADIGCKISEHTTARASRIPWITTHEQPMLDKTINQSGNCRLYDDVPFEQTGETSRASTNSIARRRQEIIRDGEFDEE